MSLSLPPKPNLEQLKKQAKDLLKAHQNGDNSVCETFGLVHRFADATAREILDSSVSLQEAQFALALAYGYKDWSALKAYVESTETERGSIKAESNATISEGLSTQLDGMNSKLTEDDSAVIQIINNIMAEAYEKDVSDIHIEPLPGNQPTTVRMRTDGVMYVSQTIHHNAIDAVTSRIKRLSDLDTSEHEMPQYGRLVYGLGEKTQIEARVATIPAQTGESVVLRILAAGKPIPLDAMGFTEDNYSNLSLAIRQPFGLIFVCGPTGSGKTITLHAILGFLNRPELKIYTVEDPIEITQKGIVQVAARHRDGLDYATAVRSFLRADPDIIMVGETRDHETANICIETALTGHLVFSTLHTGNSPVSITRLLDMGLDSYNLADAILCILSQRLVHTLCKHCKEQYHPSKEEYDELVGEYGKGLFERHLNIEHTDALQLYGPKGCPECHGRGYRGRMAIHELLMGTDEVKKLVLNQASEDDIRTQAAADGMTTFKQDGISKVFDGHCDLLQVRKASLG